MEESLREGLLGRGRASEVGDGRVENEVGVEEDGRIFIGDRLGFEVDREGLGKVFEWTTGDLVGTGRPKGLASVIVSLVPRKAPHFPLLETPDPFHPSSTRVRWF
jgi:hypothetical protein